MGTRRSVKTQQKSGFKVQWVKFPLRWIRILREVAATGSTYDLALTILVESFKLEQMAVKEVILSAEVTGLPRMSRMRAINNLVRLNLIKIRRGKGKAVRVLDLYIFRLEHKNKNRRQGYQKCEGTCTKSVNVYYWSNIRSATSWRWRPRPPAASRAHEGV
jgi:hypothetical protein